MAIKPTLENLINKLRSNNWLKTPLIIDAFLKIKREDFVPDDEKEIAYLDTALPIGYNQTISQPSVVAFMLELLQPHPGEKILDVGAGSGWTAALLGYCVQPQGKVIALDIIKELVEWGRGNVSKYNFIKSRVVQYIYADGKNGYPKEAPFDKILVSAGTSEIPLALKQQLKIGGKMVIPIYESLVEIQKIDNNNFRTKEYPGFVFVPLV